MLLQRTQREQRKVSISPVAHAESIDDFKLRWKKAMKDVGHVRRFSSAIGGGEYSGEDTVGDAALLAVRRARPPAPAPSLAPSSLAPGRLSAIDSPALPRFPPCLSPLPPSLSPFLFPFLFPEQPERARAQWARPR